MQVLFAMNLTGVYPCERDEMGDRGTSLPFFSHIKVFSYGEQLLGCSENKASKFDRDLNLISAFWRLMLRR